MEGSVTLKHPERALLQKTLSSSFQGFLSTFSLSRRAVKPHWHFMWTERQPTYARVRPEDHPCHPFLATHSGKTLEDRLGGGGTCAFGGAGAQLVETEEEIESVCCPRSGASAATARVCRCPVRVTTG